MFMSLNVALILHHSDAILHKSNSHIFFYKGYAHCVDVYIKQCQEVRIKNFLLYIIFCCVVEQ